MKIEQLLEQYFEGLTSSEEEAFLRRYFTTGDVPENLMMYKPLFMHFDSEIKMLSTDSERLSEKTEQTGTNRTDRRTLIANRTDRRTSLVWWLSGAAACAAILAGSFFMSSQQKRCPGKGDYVMIDGRCFTDAETIRSAMLKSLHEVSTEDEFSPDINPANVFNLIENQLKEFDFLLDE